MKKKTGAYLRWSCKSTFPRGLLVETRLPDADTPAAFLRELRGEQRAPWGTSFAQSQARRYA